MRRALSAAGEGLTEPLLDFIEFCCPILPKGVLYSREQMRYTGYNLRACTYRKQKGRTYMKKLLAVTFSLICLLGLSGCLFHRENPYPYRGEYKELYTAAIYSIPDAEGYIHHGEGAFSPDIYVWEQDDYGRTLFSYCEDYGNQIFALVLCQGFDETHVYFYPDANYALTLIRSDSIYPVTKEDYLKSKTEALYLEQGDRLKEENHWNQPLDRSKCVSYPITDHKVLGGGIYSLSADQCDEILIAYTQTLNLKNTEKSPHRYNKILQVDAEGKILHEIRGIHQNCSYSEGNTSITYYITLWIITDPNGNYDKENGVLVMYSKAAWPFAGCAYDAKDILEFKEKNNWVYPESGM